MKTRIMYIEYKGDELTGDARNWKSKIFKDDEVCTLSK